MMGPPGDPAEIAYGDDYILVGPWGGANLILQDGDGKSILEI